MLTAQDIKLKSRIEGISLTEAKRDLDKLAMLQQLNNAKTVQDLKPLLLKLIQEL